MTHRTPARRRLPIAAAALATTGNGVPPSVGVQLINNLSIGAPLRDMFSFSPSTGVQAWNLDSALCLRNLLTGTAARALLPAIATTPAAADAVRLNGNTLVVPD